MYGTLDSEAALREKNKEIFLLKKELEEARQRGFAKVEILAPPPAAYDDPSPTTDGKIAAERLRHPKYIEMIHTQEIKRVKPPIHKLSLVKVQSYDNYTLPPDIGNITALEFPALWTL